MPTDPTGTAIRTVPGRLPLAGHAVRILRSPLEFFTSLRTHGDVVTIRLGPQAAYVVTDPELVRRVLVQNSKEFERGVQFEKARPFLGDGLFTEPEPAHLRHRRLMQPAFHHARLAEHVDLMRDIAERQVDRWRDGDGIDVDHEALTFTVGVLSRALFSSTVPAAAIAAEVERSLPVLLDGLARRVALPAGILGRIPTAGNRRFMAAHRRLRATLEEVIAGYRRDETDHRDVLSLLRDELDDAHLRDHALAIFVGGTETTAYAISWTCHLLGRHPEIQERVAAETDQALRDHPLTADRLPRLPMLRRVLTESLRLYPPVWLVSRRATREVRLGPYRIPAGGNVLFANYAIHRDPATYDRPDEFDPDRWLPGAPAVPRGAYLPFGAGNRSCIGESFAWTEMAVFLAVLLRSWRLRPGPVNPFRPMVAAGLRPAPAPTIVRRRGALGPRSG